MEDVQIIDLFFRRDPAALEAVEARYGKKCLAAACHILPDRRDAEECVSDVWLRLWNAIPPERPRSLAATGRGIPPPLPETRRRICAW